MLAALRLAAGIALGAIIGVHAFPPIRDYVLKESWQPEPLLSLAILAGVLFLGTLFVALFFVESPRTVTYHVAGGGERKRDRQGRFSASK